MDEETRMFAYRLDQVKGLLESAYHTEDRALQLASFSAASVLIQWLENGEARYDINFDVNRARKLAAVRMHFAAMLGLDEMKDMTAEGHYRIAHQAVEEMQAHPVA